MEKMVRTISKVNPRFWKNKKVFLTGHSGFKGSWTSIWLSNMGAIVKGFSLPPNIHPNLFEEAKISEHINSEFGDIRDFNVLKKSMISFSPEIIIHMAAQPLVRKSYEDPIETYTTNVIGTLNVLEIATKHTNVKTILIITTDKCYENNEMNIGFKESDPMGGHDPYSSSKGCCELLVSSYRRSFCINANSPKIASVRAGNVIGGGDWSNDRLIPDILKAFQNNNKVLIRNPQSIRPWQHVLEPISGYFILIEKLFISENDFSEAWNFGPDYDDCKSVRWITKKLCNLWGDNAKWDIDKSENPHEAGFLKLDYSKAVNRLGWVPKWNINFSLKLIVQWHKKWLDNEDIYRECIEQIKLYSK